jgi:hypothetical protein
MNEAGLVVERMVQNYKPEASMSPLDYAFDILKSVRWTANRNWKGTPYSVNTRWSIVYDQTNLCIHFKSHGNRKTRVVFLKSFDFSCKKPAKIFDSTSNLSGDVSKNFIEYTQQNNRQLIENAFKKHCFSQNSQPNNWTRCLNTRIPLHVGIN